MLDHYTTPGESIEIRDNQTIYLPTLPIALPAPARTR